MSVELITGRGTTDHVGAEDFGAYQAYTFGVGAYILHGCEASVVDSNTVRISEGELLVQGRHVRVKGSEDIAIQSGTAGRNRKDMVCVRYAKDLNGVEDAPLAVIVGTPVEGGSFSAALRSRRYPCRRCCGRFPPVRDSDSGTCGGGAEGDHGEGFGCAFNACG